MHIGSSEDPLFRRMIPRGKEIRRKTHCPLDSSQKSAMENGILPASCSDFTHPLAAAEQEKQKKVQQQTKEATKDLENHDNIDLRGTLDSVLASEVCTTADRHTASVLEGQSLGMNHFFSVSVQTVDLNDKCKSTADTCDMTSVLGFADKSRHLEDGQSHMCAAATRTDAVETKQNDAISNSHSSSIPHNISSSSSPSPEASMTVPHAAKIAPHGTVMAPEEDMTPSNENSHQMLQCQSERNTETKLTSFLAYSGSSRSVAIQVAMDDFSPARVDGPDGGGGFGEDGTCDEESLKGGGTGCHGNRAGSGDDGEGGRGRQVVKLRCPEEMSDDRLQHELEVLKEKLQLSESTAIWQSLMIKLYQMNQDSLG